MHCRKILILIYLFASLLSFYPTRGMTNDNVSHIIIDRVKEVHLLYFQPRERQDFEDAYALFTNIQKTNVSFPIFE